jgi:PAS domain-containing protein
VAATTVLAQIRHDNDVAELADQQALTRTLFAGSPDMIVAANSSRRLVTLNPAAEELSGHRRDEVLGQEGQKSSSPSGNAPRSWRTPRRTWRLVTTAWLACLRR